MPGMDGLDLLHEIRQKWPPRIEEGEIAMSDDILRRRDELMEARRGSRENEELLRRRDALIAARRGQQLKTPLFKSFPAILSVASGVQTIARGNVGFPVCMVQAALSVGPDSVKLVADGIFGWRTEEAVRRFQRRKQIEATGNVNSETIKALDDHVGRLPRFRL
jgi:peptidoglycan hydrolase-like protein with peptidoglycan-binding domain